MSIILSLVVANIMHCNEATHSLFFADILPDLSQLCQVQVEVIDVSSLPVVHSKQPHIIRCRSLLNLLQYSYDGLP